MAEDIRSSGGVAAIASSKVKKKDQTGTRTRTQPTPKPPPCDITNLSDFLDTPNNTRSREKKKEKRTDGKGE